MLKLLVISYSCYKIFNTQLDTRRFPKIVANKKVFVLTTEACAHPNTADVRNMVKYPWLAYPTQQLIHGQ